MLPVSPKKKPVDLDALTGELMAADISFLDYTYHNNSRRFECFGWVIWTGDETVIWFNSLPSDPSIWSAFDIIRKHVEAV